MSKYSVCVGRGQGGIYNRSAYHLKPDFATLRLRKCGNHHYSGPLPISRLSRWSTCRSPDAVAPRKFAPRLGARRSAPTWMGRLLAGGPADPRPLPHPPTAPGSAPRPPARRALVPPAVSSRVLGRGCRQDCGPSAEGCWLPVRP